MKEGEKQQQQQQQHHLRDLPRGWGAAGRGCNEGKDARRDKRERAVGTLVSWPQRKRREGAEGGGGGGDDGSRGEREQRSAGDGPRQQGTEALGMKEAGDRVSLLLGRKGGRGPERKVVITARWAAG